MLVIDICTFWLWFDLPVLALYLLLYTQDKLQLLKF